MQPSKPSGASNGDLRSIPPSVNRVKTNATITVNGASAHVRYMQLTLPLIWERMPLLRVNSAKAAIPVVKPLPVYTPLRGAINLAGGAAITMAGDNSSEKVTPSARKLAGIVDGSSGGRFVIDGDIRAAGATAASGTLPQQNSTIKPI